MTAKEARPPVMGSTVGVATDAINYYNTVFQDTLDRMVYVKVDRVGFHGKPTSHIGEITRRLQECPISHMSIRDLMQAVQTGHAWMGGCFEPRTWDHINGNPNMVNYGTFIGQQLFAVDFDHATGPDGREDPNAPAPDPMSTLERAIAIGHGITPVFWYPTFSATVEPWDPRHRIVFTADELLNDRYARACDLMLKSVFSECDDGCFNRHHNRILQGTCHRCHPIAMGGAA